MNQKGGQDFNKLGLGMEKMLLASKMSLLERYIEQNEKGEFEEKHKEANRKFLQRIKNIKKNLEAKEKLKKMELAGGKRRRTKRRKKTKKRTKRRKKTKRRTKRRGKKSRKRRRR